MTRYPLVSCLVLALAPACAGEVLSLDADVGTGGSDEPGSGGQAVGTGGQSVGVGGQATGGFFGSGGSLATGQVMRFRSMMKSPIPDGDVEVPAQLTLTPLEGGTATGTIVIGDGPEPPLDLMRAYPEPPQPVSSMSAQVVDSFAYSLSSATLNHLSLSFEVQLAEAYFGWCGAQPVFAQPPGTGRDFGCIPWVDSGLDCSAGDYDACVGSDGTNEVTLAWGVWAMCLSQICTCAADGCVATAQVGLTFDLEFQDRDLVGLMNNEDPVRFVRIEE